MPSISAYTLGNSTGASYSIWERAMILRRVEREVKTTYVHVRIVSAVADSGDFVTIRK